MQLKFEYDKKSNGTLTDENGRTVTLHGNSILLADLYNLYNGTDFENQDIADLRKKIEYLNHEFSDLDRDNDQLQDSLYEEQDKNGILRKRIEELENA